MFQGCIFSYLLYCSLQMSIGVICLAATVGSTVCVLLLSSTPAASEDESLHFDFALFVLTLI